MQKIEDKKLLLAVSGGPDSIFMLEKFKHKNIIVAHINYNKREDSINDQKIVENFCNKEKIKLYIFNVNKNFIYKKNFQSHARKIRYEYFKKIYNNEKCDYLLLAHNKDDFIETALMQKSKNKIVNYWGIKKYIHINNMNVYRPFLFKLWKRQIEAFLIKKNINFAIDSSNSSLIYNRNKIRFLYKNKIFIKFFYLILFMFLNIFLNIKNYLIHKKYSKWEQNNFLLDFFRKQRNKKKLIYYCLNQKFINLNLTSKKIKSIIQFIEAKNQSNKYMLKKNYFLIKKNKKLHFKTTL
ncbi:tRNA lysidine(34) synthetase TilS [[Mycoplasma] collis]|uniref:tRNA lysidine(34) synthetase TilS n=1 Tax=[Mycoplasma] collis TaxID=2127 RepID=UPI00051B8F68|nr:tRNA lysidine(34) synthetase TilS [[Mycoplasma] collis]